MHIRTQVRNDIKAVIAAPLAAIGFRVADERPFPFFPNELPVAVVGVGHAKNQKQASGSNKRILERHLEVSIAGFISAAPGEDVDAKLDEFLEAIEIALSGPKALSVSVTDIFPTAEERLEEQEMAVPGSDVTHVLCGVRQSYPVTVLTPQGDPANNLLRGV